MQNHKELWLFTRVKIKLNHLKMILNGLKYQKYTSENELQVLTCLYMVYI